MDMGSMGIYYPPGTAQNSSQDPEGAQLTEEDCHRPL